MCGADKNSRLINMLRAVCSCYDSVCYFDLSDDKACFFTDGVFSEEIPSAEAAERIIPENIPEIQRKELISALSCESIRRRQTEEKNYSVDIPCSCTDDLHFIQLKIIAADNDHALVCRSDNAAEASHTEEQNDLSELSHEIHSSLDSIISLANLASVQPGLPANIRSSLTKITHSADELLETVNSSININSISAAKNNGRKQKCSLSQMLRKIYSTVYPAAEKNNLTIFMDAIDIYNDEVYCDRNMLQKVLLNLISNAIKFTRPDGKIYIRLLERNSTLRCRSLYEFHIKDTGIGMSESFIEHIFEPYARETVNHTVKINGNGLGYTVVKKIVDQLHGTIVIDSAEGKGTDVEVCFNFEHCRKPFRPEPVKGLSGSRALVYGKCFDTCESVAKMLNSLGISADWIMDRNEARLRFRHAAEDGMPYELLIINIDVQPSDISSVLNQLRQINNFTAVIASYDINAVPDDVRSGSSNILISKPLHISELESSLLEYAGSTT